MIRGTLSLLSVFLGFVSIAKAVDCDSFRVRVSSFCAVASGVRDRATTSFLDCSLGHPDERKADEIRRDFVAAMEQLIQDFKTSDWETDRACIENHVNIGNFMSSLSAQMGDMTSQTIIACSEKAQAILSDKNLSARKKRKMLKPLQPDIDAIIKRSKK